MLTSANGAARPDPEVLEKARRRRFTAEYKASVLREYEATPKGERGALLRREGCTPFIQRYAEEDVTPIRFATTLTVSPARASAINFSRCSAVYCLRMPPCAPGQYQPARWAWCSAYEVALLRRRVARLEHQLQRAQKVIEVQKKISEILGIEQNLPDDLKEES